MKVVQYGFTDTMGTRFNGQDLHQALCKRKLHSHHLVWEKKGQDLNTTEITRSRVYRKFNHWLNGLERRFSIQSLLQPAFLWTLFNKHFRAADVVHYHLIHTGFFSLLGLPLLSKMRASVWTLHDPWAMTGHCIHPFDCERWKIGCGSCPNLKSSFPMLKDNTAFMWKMKKNLYANSKLDIIVASKWMQERVQQSPLFSPFRIHHIPFGLDLTRFEPGDMLAKRKKLGIPKDNIVLCVRSTLNEYKGLSFVQEAVAKIKTNKNITLLTFNEKGHFDHYLGQHQLLELGWTDDLELTLDAYQAADIFLMPSLAESFGMMAMEAMSCGKPVIVFENTALAEVIFGNKGGIAIPYKSTDALTKALQDLIDNTDARRAIGQSARNLAIAHYDIEQQVDRILDVYQEAQARHQKERKI